MSLNVKHYVIEKAVSLLISCIKRLVHLRNTLYMYYIRSTLIHANSTNACTITITATTVYVSCH